MNFSPIINSSHQGSILDILTPTSLKNRFNAIHEGGYLGEIITCEGYDLMDLAAIHIMETWALKGEYRDSAHLSAHVDAVDRIITRMQFGTILFKKAGVAQKMTTLLIKTRYLEEAIRESREFWDFLLKHKAAYDNVDRLLRGHGITPEKEGYLLLLANTLLAHRSFRSSDQNEITELHRYALELRGRLNDRARDLAARDGAIAYINWGVREQVTMLLFPNGFKTDLSIAHGRSYSEVDLLNFGLKDHIYPRRDNGESISILQSSKGSLSNLSVMSDLKGELYIKGYRGRNKFPPSEKKGLDAYIKGKGVIYRGGGNEPINGRGALATQDMP